MPIWTRKSMSGQPCCCTGNEASLRKCLKLKMRSKDKTHLKVKTPGLFSEESKTNLTLLCVCTHMHVSLLASLSLCVPFIHIHRERGGDLGYVYFWDTVELTTEFHWECLDFEHLVTPPMGSPF